MAESWRVLRLGFGVGGLQHECLRNLSALEPSKKPNGASEPGALRFKKQMGVPAAANQLRSAQALGASRRSYPRGMAGKDRTEIQQGNSMSKETLYRKVGRKYIPMGEAEHYDYIIMPPQGFTLTHRKEGVTQWEYAVKPDNAGFVAAAMVARAAMEDAIRQAATYRPSAPIPYTKKQLKLIEKFKIEMGMLYPTWWEQTSARE